MIHFGVCGYFFNHWKFSIVGIVDEPGPSVREFLPGQRVFGDFVMTRGGFAEYACLPASDLVEGMLKQLATPDEAWRPYWDARMVWYGPGGLGSYSTIDAFGAFQRPFELTFDGWGDGKEDGIEGVGSHCKAGDGDYAFLHGWRQITGIHVRPFMGLEPTGRRVFMRDCDWWRCKDGKIIENWCMLDLPHVLHQLDYDVFANLEQAA